MDDRTGHYNQRKLIALLNEAITSFIVQKSQKLKINRAYTLTAEISKDSVHLGISESNGAAKAREPTRLDEEVANLECKVATMGAELSDSKECIEEMRSKLRAKEGEVKQSEAKVREKASEVARLNEELAVLGGQLAINGADLTGKRKCIEEMRSKLMANESEASALKGKIAELKYASSKHLDEYNKGKTDLEAKVGAYKFEVSSLIEKVAKLESAALESWKIWDHNSKYIANLIHENSTAKEKLQSAAFEIHNHINERRRCKLEIISLEERIVKLEESFKSATEFLPEQLKNLVCSLYEKKKICFNKVCSMLE
ncbi:uncharacterized protein LOC108028441 [Drosophila biarmipes]|uniref:uncharacterized protein LOC108028441 n=1 Tax=Drosophila biarmipes TaxID=125945 RepID=UPI0007E79FCB|nr:uncharacterized protein LOC108028441 [Drosophila biarmipes]